MIKIENSRRNGRIIAGYIRFSKNAVVDSRPTDNGMVLDFDTDGHLVGIEVTAPSLFNLESLERVLRDCNFIPRTGG